MANKLELTWYGKENEIKIEPRLLIENKELSNTEKDPQTENLLIHGDNLLALKALENNYAGKVKCIYIDPPYNTGSAFEHYDDNLEHSQWLSLMKPRLELLKNLLSDDGCIFIQIDNNEMAYLKVLCDEVFGRRNFINMISVNMKNTAGASGGGEDKRLKKNCEYILIYSKNYNYFENFNPTFEYTEMIKVVEDYRKQNKTWHYNSILIDAGEKIYIGSTETGNGSEIKVYVRKNPVIKSIKQTMKEENLTEEEVYYKYSNFIFEAKDAQTSIRDRVINAKINLDISEDLVSIEYVPTTGKNKGKIYEQFYKGNKCRLLAWLKDIGEIRNGILYKKDLQGTYWDLTAQINNVTKEGTVIFPNGKKPEELIKRIIYMSTTNPGDLVLDSFLGSGTTAAVAHKMGRRWIGIEMGDHAYTHCKVRLDKVISGEDKGGITKSANWLGGGGYRFYELAPSLINVDAFGEYIINKDYNADMLAAAVALHEGFTYNPSEETFWKQSTGSENSYLFVTTKHITAAYLQTIAAAMQEGEYLIIACKSFDKAAENAFKNIVVKKIPQMLLSRCEFNKDNYNLNIVHPPVYDEVEDDE